MIWRWQIHGESEFCGSFVTNTTNKRENERHSLINHLSLVNSAFRRQDLINNAKEREKKNSYENAKFQRDIMTKLCKHQMKLLWNLLKFVIGEDKC